MLRGVPLTPAETAAAIVAPLRQSIVLTGAWPDYLRECVDTAERAIADAIEQARREATEQAAKVADWYASQLEQAADTERVGHRTVDRECAAAAKRIAAGIRANWSPVEPGRDER